MHYFFLLYFLYHISSLIQSIFKIHVPKNRKLLHLKKAFILFTKINLEFSSI